VFAGVSAKDTRSQDALTDLPIEERLKRHIIDGERIGLEEALTQALQTYPPLEIINTFLLDGMKVVGELFGSGQMQLPFVLQSAETMKAAVAHLEPFMEKSEAGNNAKGTFLIATVKGDVHDIGKNLVDIILTNNGYRVINLGIKQPVDAIIDAYEEYKADCIAMSGLLVKSTAFMKENLQVFNDRGITVPVILGGAALTPKFVYEDCQSVYNGQVIYGKDAFSDLHFMDKLMPAKAIGEWDDHQGFLNQAEAGRKSTVRQPDTQAAEPSLAPDEDEDTRRSEAVEVAIDRPTPPFWGTKVLRPDDISLTEVINYLDLQALIAGQWQFRKPKEQSREAYDAFLQEKVYPVLAHWQQRVVEENLLHPQVVYGYFPCLAEGNSLHLYDPTVATTATEIPTPIATFQFPRQKSLRRLCIADFFRPLERDRPPVFDVFPMQAVTMGEIATEFAQTLFEAHQYTDYLYFHGLAVQMAEALAEWTHARIRHELGFAAQEPDTIRDILAQRYPGSRYSFGYPACPNIHDQFVLLNVLESDRIGLVMDDSEQLHPEQSTTAIVAYHPVAKYFSA
jgi:5-methyltetrahydrofolate--homocysteine methyltransferase